MVTLESVLSTKMDTHCDRWCISFGGKHEPPLSCLSCRFAAFVVQTLNPSLNLNLNLNLQPALRHKRHVPPTPLQVEVQAVAVQLVGHHTAEQLQVLLR